ncbi:hypothetical protein A2696_01850 [Candidatus Curtissbacteria bacterium RIFCSPHIGHO2_01_FULL_41_13]|uniref:Uncharacterized protein n=1 Tax=Candidatus Curtissbacteria bacterium RIFCSPHIGHO2_01_FULL_41_13 TaxID=1797745 RepID=A0A1F5G1G9_9BACT|nr:MAG: hypothetical protein A2696_01850 [Candidatus Curtissbacteria bacterium RIFCSPHIGHO2_01_FULL_41_13]
MAERINSKQVEFHSNNETSPLKAEPQPTTYGEGAGNGGKKTAIGLFEDDNNLSRQTRKADLVLLSKMKPINQGLQDYIKEQARGKK